MSTPVTTLPAGRETLSFEVEHSATAPEVSRFKLLTVGELAAIIPPPPLVDGAFSQSGFSSIVAPYSCFKSFITLGLDLCIAHGLDWYGRRVSPGLVVYQAGEGASGLSARIEAWRVFNGLPEVGGILFLPQTLKLNDPRDLHDILAVLRGLTERPMKVTFDTYARSLRGNENASDDTGVYVEAVDAIREEIGCHVQIVHHTGWEGTRSRGSSSLPGALDTEITLTREKGEDRVTVTCTKQKDLEEFGAFTLEAVPVAGSLAFRAFAPTSAKLSTNEREVLRVVQESGCLKTTPWLEVVEASHISKRSFYNAKSRLLTLAYVKKTADGFSPTEAGRQVQ